MNIDVIISADYIREDIIKDKIVVVIDMLRATSVITAAIKNGCKEVIPTLTVEEAFKKQDELGKENCILGGERKAIKVHGFDFSNSPLEYTEERIKGKSIVLSTTNGTRTLTSCLSAGKIYVGSVLNATAVAQKLVEENRDVVIVNSGTNGQFSMDDYICTGFIIKEVTNLTNKIYLSDIAKAAMKAYEGNPDITSYIKDARHYGVMLNLKLEEDLGYCVQKNITNVVPKYIDGHIIGIS
ncbi:2-phosphosulfolactate phosphatase [Clostridium sp. DSM 8431]|uniref:2-phosphosulfolactate phosphatase n=1 Tax=Clostridium sp. DSM 8431 TaxID=1761781 RepID=UPI0008E9FAF0|nr:2-phosphosulfolactate phosphatase [Clostridium sp. DSM 8431]SFU60827.1 2-phosphosulfolactate phosphatase [Clostridium sp. DSM 8431]